MSYKSPKYWYYLPLMLLFVFSACNQNRQHQGLTDEDSKWIKIQGGVFMMGNPQGVGEFNEFPEHEETVKTFKIQKTETTVAQYMECINADVCWPTLEPDNDHYCNFDKPDRLNHPINCVDWYQANIFCTWSGGRLPTEAEWEYAARSGGKDNLYAWGNEPTPNCDVVVMDSDTEGIGCGAYMTWEVCSKPKGNTEQGVCDMAGNVIEWAYDWYYLNYKPKLPNQRPPDITNMKTGDVGPNRVMRGAGIGSSEDYRTRNRIYHDPEFQYGGLGIRCVRDV